MLLLPPPREKGYLLNALVVFLGVLAAIVIGELALRMILPIVEPKIEVSNTGSLLHPDPILVWRTIPNAPGLDERGFKDPKGMATATMVALGDSHTFGGFSLSTTEDISWPRRLEEILRVPVYNMGVWGYGFAQYAALVNTALELHPKTIVVGVFMGNDVFDTYDVIYHAQGWKDVRDPNFADDIPKTAADEKKITIPFRSIRDFFRDHSVLYAFLGDRTRAWREELGISQARTIGTSDWLNTDPEESLRFAIGSTTETLFWPGSRIRGVDLDEKNVREGMRLSEEIIRGMARRAANHHTRIVFAFLPTKLSAYAPTVAAARLSNPIFDSVVKNETKIRQEFEKICSEEHITCIDVLPAMQDAVRHGLAVYAKTWDEHPTPLGYEIYARSIATGLKGEGTP